MEMASWLSFPPSCPVHAVCGGVLVLTADFFLRRCIGQYLADFVRAACSWYLTSMCVLAGGEASSSFPPLLLHPPPKLKCYKP
ncbi:hypothetical protein Y1Q_0021872 [Alligator mississippiensis]|uniref:Uncharacterized protein n=1 Tax=Alligator mississippiensis TaxID=8496 RepID=A0A151MSR9_ALLMI|nr:hypothetical protein Y1Q_0021872 [Alligator mississippiensis]